MLRSLSLAAAAASLCAASLPEVSTARVTALEVSSLRATRHLITRPFASLLSSPPGLDNRIRPEIKHRSCCFRPDDVSTIGVDVSNGDLSAVADRSAEWVSVSRHFVHPDPPVDSTPVYHNSIPPPLPRHPRSLSSSGGRRLSDQGGWACQPGGVWMDVCHCFCGAAIVCCSRGRSIVTVGRRTTAR